MSLLIEARQLTKRFGRGHGRLGLDSVGGHLMRTYSGGMRRRLDLGASLVGRPRVLLIDEPTTGLLTAMTGTVRTSPITRRTRGGWFRVCGWSMGVLECYIRTWVHPLSPDIRKVSM